MNNRKSMGQRVSALLLTLVLCLTMVPQLAFAAGCVTASADAATAYTVKTGQQLAIDLTEVFSDASGHELTYTLDDGNYGTQTKIAANAANGHQTLYFANPTAGTYTPTVTAACKQGGTTSVRFTVTVEAGAAGDAAQYGYDETPADTVSVYVTVSSDGVPLTATDGTVLSHLKVDVPYFDLDKQGLSDYYRYGTKNGSGAYVNEELVKRPTALHLYLYLLGVYYLGLSPEEVTSGAEQIVGHDGGMGVYSMNGSRAYDDTKLALNITGSATSLYMQQFWGHDENLMYYRNHVYPLMSAGWGSTADYILLSDGDTIDLAMFSDWQFWTRGAFAAFNEDDYTVMADQPLTFQTVKYETRSVADGGSESFRPITGLNVTVYDADWQPVGAVEADSGNRYTYTFSQAGTYYLMAADANAGTGDACYAPATAKVTVTSAPVPTRKADYPAETAATVQTNRAYLLSDLQSGRIFQPADGQKLTYENYYYQRSTDGGKTWSPMTRFTSALFGATTIQITEQAEGVYTYRFCASHDGKNFSADTWTLTLTVEDAPVMDFTFLVGQDYTGAYPTIKLYTVEQDKDGNEVLGKELENCFLYSNFTGTLPEGEAAYDPAAGKLADNYQTFYARLTAGRYGYRAFTADGTALGGMMLDLPTDTNVDGLAGGGTNIYLQCVSFYTSSKKLDKTYFTADEYHVRVDCPIMKTSCAMGDVYSKGNYAYYPTVLYAAGNACLYNSYGYPDLDGYIFTQNINQTFPASYRAGTKTVNINTAVELTVTVPDNAEFGLYFQWNNFNTTEVAPDWGDADAPYADRWKDNGDGTKTATYFISKSNSNYTWRLSDAAHVTQAGWLGSVTAAKEMTFAFGEDAATDRRSHDFSQLGTQTSKRDEADLQVNLDPSGYEAISGTTRVRAYRHWQLINSDAGNIMVEPDFHWNVAAGDATLETVNAGNATANWADVTPGTQDSILTVYYDSVDVNPGSHGTHGGLFPATSPARVGVIVVGGADVTHGTADADVDFNMKAGATTTRSMDWDYNYDTWFYGANETDPTLDFAVKATGDVTVEYAFVTTTDNMTTSVSDFRTVSASNGRCAVPLAAFNTSGNGMGGTVIIKMTDSTGVSYRLVRVAKVTITAENVSNPGEDLMPGDQVKLSFRGMYRAVNKISGVFNPTIFEAHYSAGDADNKGTLGQYQRMDNVTVTATVPEDVSFADGAETAEYVFTNGYTYGSMYSAANPFAFLYNMTDAGVGTNFNAVTVTYYLNHYADAVVTVHRKVTYDVALRVTDGNGKTLTGVTVALTDADGSACEAGSNGRFTLGYGSYAYTLSKSGYVTARGSFSLGSADADRVKNGVLTIGASMDAAGTNSWDGKTLTQPQTDENGVYQIGTGAELAWFAANGGEASAVLTADIELAGCDWTPMSKLYGSFDGQGHVIRNLYVNKASHPLGLFGYLQSGASVTRLGVTGDVICSAKSSAQAGGIAGYMNDKSTVTQCWSAVNVTTAKHGGGIAGYAANGAAITDCYATGTIRTTAANECYLGGIVGAGFSRTAGATLTNCYTTSTVIGSGNTASYVGGLSAVSAEAKYVNSYYLTGSVSGGSPKYGVTGLGVAKTADELKALAETLGGSFAADPRGKLNSGYPILTWQVVDIPVIPGDVNDDGTVDDTDAAMVYAFVNAKLTPNDLQSAAADVNGDGKITAADAELIYAFYLGEIKSLTANN